MFKTVAYNMNNSSLEGANAIGPRRMEIGFCAQNLKGLNTNSVVAMARQKVKAMTTSSAVLVKAPNLLAETSSTPMIIPAKEKKQNYEEEEEKEGVSINRESGKYGKFGGKFVPETLMTWLTILEAEFKLALHDSHFQEELATVLRDYVGRETPLCHAQKLTSYYKDKNAGLGPEIYLKREDLCHGGSHQMNNAVGQAMLAKRLGKTMIVAATGSGQHGVAVAAASAKLGLECTVFMGACDMKRQSSNVDLMNSLGAQVVSVKGSFKDASSDAFRASLSDMNNNYYLLGSGIGPHPYPMMVRELQSVIGKEVRKQSMERWGGEPDILLACVGSGSNALGLFHEFIQDQNVRLIGVEGAGFGLETGFHSATLAKGSVGVYHGAMSYLLQDDEGQILEPRSIAVGLESPGVCPELSYLKETRRAEFHAVTDIEAVNAFKRLCKLEGMFPGLESAHALAYLDELCPTLSDGTKVVVNISGCGDKDVNTVFQCNLMEQWTTII